MFAAQLLRILETIPSDVESETCVDESAEQDMIMKENQIETLHDSNSFGREVDLLEFDSKEVYEINGLKMDTHPSPKFVDDLSLDNQEVTAGKEFQNGLSYRLSSSEKAETESKVSMSPFIAASNPFEKDNNLFNDKIVLECENPELIVCYKEVNYHVVKDICIDKGMLVNRDFLTYSNKADQSEHSPLNDDSHCKATEDVHEEFLISDELTATSLDNTKGNIGNGHGSEEECHAPDKDVAKDCDKKESFVDNSLPIQEFGTRSFLRSFLNSLDDGALPDQISSGKVVSEDCTPSSAETGLKEDIQATNLHYNSKVETGSITFNFKSLEPVLGGITNVGPENIKDPVSENSHAHITLETKDENPILPSRGEIVNSHEHRDPDNDVVASFRRYDEGETSFSASGLTNYSGPIVFSGALSDGSATSGRSFAFPVLQNEWNSSPVRMAKKDGGHFRKHRGWRSGLLCCRF